MIKLLALDLDGTLLDASGAVRDAEKCAIRAAEEAGVLVTIATGRRFRDACPVARELDLNAPLISHNGALVKYADTLETVAASLLDPATTQEILRIGKQYGGDALVSADPNGRGTLLYDRVSEENVPLQRYLAWGTKLHGEDASEAVIRVDDLSAAVPFHDVIHISFSGTCGTMQRLLGFLEKELRGQATILSTIYPKRDFTLIDILPPGSTKGTGVGTLAARMNIQPDQIMAIGDNFNDLGMLEFAGTPVIMGNADNRLLERPEFYKTLSNDESGVAAAIDRFILAKET